MSCANVPTLKVTDNDLDEFHNLIAKIETEGIGAEVGAVKVSRLEFLVDFEKSSTLCQLLCQSINEVTKQVLCLTLEDGLLNYFAQNATVTEVTSFKENFEKKYHENESNCCLEALKCGMDRLLQHVSEVAKSVATKCTSLKKRRSMKERLLDAQQKGKNIKDAYEEMLQLGRFVPSLKIESDPKEPSCRCLACYDYDCQFRVTYIKEQRKNDIFYASGIIIDENFPVWITEKFCLPRIVNILQALPFYYEGLCNSFFYLGRLHSFFVIHIEVAALWSVNYLHFGSPKLWVIIKPSALLLLDFHLNKSGANLSDSSCRYVLGHKSLLPTIKWLKDRQIPYEIREHGSKSLNGNQSLNYLHQSEILAEIETK